MFQPDRCVNGRKERPILFLGKHVAIHIVLMAIASFIAMSMNNSFHLPVFLLSGQAILLISICHYLIDYGKMKLNDNLKGTGNQAFLFLLDQMLHFLTIWIAFHGLHISTRLLDNGTASFFRGWTTDEKIVATGCVFILATYGADRFLQIVLQDIMPNHELQEGIYRLSDEKNGSKNKTQE